MPLVLAVVFILLVYLFFQWQRSKPSPENEVRFGTSVAAGTAAADIAAGLRVVFISDGKLFYQADDGRTEQLHSPYVQEIQDRLERSQARHSWKQDTSFAISAGGGRREFRKDDHRIAVTAVQFVDDHTLLYFMQDEAIGGLFSYDFRTKTERRILHKQGLSLNDLFLDAEKGTLLGSSVIKNGMANIVTLTAEGNAMRELTGGDTYDCAPAWTSSAKDEIVYQSMGLARDPNGYIVAQGNASIQRLSFRNNSLDPVMEDPRYDFLCPRVCPQGNLHFIRRPYETKSYGTENFLVDTLFFPFRLLRAVFHYLNFFSMMYSRKPLTSASGPALRADLKEIILKGKRIDAERALRSESAVNGIPSLVPKSWQLIRRTPGGAEQTLATNVASYCMMSDGRIVYSNGRGVFLLDGNGESKALLKSDLVTEVLARIPSRPEASAEPLDTAQTENLHG